MFWDIIGAVIFLCVLHMISQLCSDHFEQERAVRELDRKMGVGQKKV